MNIQAATSPTLKKLPPPQKPTPPDSKADAPPAEKPAGDSVVLKGSAPHHCHVTMRDDEVDTVPPVGFRRVADQQGGGAVYIWEPVPPSPDYVALGDVADGRRAQ